MDFKEQPYYGRMQQSTYGRISNMDGIIMKADGFIYILCTLCL